MFHFSLLFVCRPLPVWACFFKDEEFTEVKHLLRRTIPAPVSVISPSSRLSVVLVVEELDVAGSAAVETVFDRNVVDELLRLSGVDILSGRNTSAQYDTDPVVVEPLGEAEGESVRSPPDPVPFGRTAPCPK